MEKEQPTPRALVASDVDAHGNVVLWDHGPTDPPETIEPDSDEHKRLEAEAKAWHVKNGDGPVPLTLDLASARHALEVEPVRYSLDPLIDADSEVEAEIAKIREQREAAAKLAAEREAAIQYTADRKAAVATVIANRAAAALEAKAPKPKPAPEPVVVEHPAFVPAADDPVPQPQPQPTPVT